MHKINVDDFVIAHKKKFLSKKETPVQKGVSFLKNKQVTQNVMSDFDKKLKEVCMEYSIKYTNNNNKIVCDDWFAIAEAEDRLNGKASAIVIKVENQYHPLDRQITLIYTTLVNNTANVLEKCEHYIGTMKTVEEFFSSINHLANTFSTDFLLKPYRGKEVDAKQIFNKLIGDTNNAEIMPIDVAKSMITNFNNMHPSWAFVKTNRNENTTNLKVPYKKENNIVVNEINLNIKETNKFRANNIVISNSKYEGFLDYLLLDFVGANFPEEIIAIIFQKTISMKQNRQKYSNNLIRSYFYGLRIRILVDPSIPKVNYNKIFDVTKKFILDKYPKFQQMIVSLTIPNI